MEKQFVSNDRLDDIDIIAIAYKSDWLVCKCCLFVTEKYWEIAVISRKFRQIRRIAEVIETFFRAILFTGTSRRSIPDSIVIDHNRYTYKMLQTLLSEQAGRQVQIQDKVKGEKNRYLQLAQTNASVALTTQLKQQGRIEERYQALQQLLHMDRIQRMECFDISHTMGENTIASCVVFGSEGPLKSDYRRFNIEGTHGDDYNRYTYRLKKRYDKDLTVEKIPDIIFIDGGKGQLNRALAVFDNLNVSWNKHKPLLIGVAKGVDRKAGLETLLIGNSEREIHLEPDNLALHLIQHIRDESHNHAISGHRKKRQKAFIQSGLESIEGVGAKRRQALLKYLGGLQGVRAATIDELASVPGISRSLAEKIFETLKH